MVAGRERDLPSNKASVDHAIQEAEAEPKTEVVVTSPTALECPTGAPNQDFKHVESIESDRRTPESTHITHVSPRIRIPDHKDTCSWALYRWTDTQERPVAARIHDRTLWFGPDHEEGNGGCEPVRDDRLDAVGAAFLRGPAGRDWTLEPGFEGLTWYRCCSIIFSHSRLAISAEFVRHTANVK
ncbi:hypothetical protein HTG_19175 [Natrinema mahii]|nr:hypothetical protein HTG_19175 [Natrinema mahii]